MSDHLLKRDDLIYPHAVDSFADFVKSPDNLFEVSANISDGSSSMCSPFFYQDLTMQYRTSTYHLQQQKGR